MKSHYVITDGGDRTMPRVRPTLKPPPLKPFEVEPPPLKPFKVLSIRDGELQVVDDHFTDWSVGAIHSDGIGSKLHNGVPFLVVPREQALTTTRLYDVSFHTTITESVKSLHGVSAKTQRSWC